MQRGVLMAVLTSGILLSHIQAIVPLYYKYGMANNTYILNSYKLFDGLEYTNYSISNGSAAGYILNTNVSGTFYLYIHNYSGIVDGTGQKFYVKNGSIVTSNYNLLAGDSLRGGSAEWGLNTASDYFYLNVHSTDREDTYITFSGVGSTFTLVASGTTDNNINALMISRDLPLPMYDKNYKVSITWESPGVQLDGKDGYYYLAKQRKWTKKISYSWSELTDTYYQLFEDFFEAFGNNLSQPFAFLIKHNDTIGGFSPILGVLDGNSVVIENVGDGVTNYWNVSLDVYVLDEDMSTDIGPWY